MANLFSLPSELLWQSINAQFPCRQQQIRSLTTLLAIRAAPCRNLVVHGLEGTGKTTIVHAILEKLSSHQIDGINGTDDSADTLRYAFIKSSECISGRQLLERTTLAIAKATGYRGVLGKCENLAQLAVDVGMLQEKWIRSSPENKRLVLVFDGIANQKESPHTLLPALARLAEIIPNLTTIFIVTSPSSHFLHFHGAPHICFPAYTKNELVQILTLHDPKPPLPSGPEDTKETWSRFGATIYDTLSKYSGRDIVSFRSVCTRVWPTFIKPVLENQLSPSPFSKLILANRSLLQNESILLSSSELTNTIIPAQQSTIIHPLTSQLPTTSRILLLASYLCSHNPPKTDLMYFSKTLSVNKRRKKGGGTALTSSRPSKNRKISRRLLGPQVVALERMLAVFHFLLLESGHTKTSAKSRRAKQEEMGVGGSADILSSISTLVALRLISKVGAVGGSDVLDGGARYRVHVGWDLVRGLGRSVGIEIEEFVVE